MVKKLLLSFVAVALVLAVTPFTSVIAQTSYVGSVVKVADSDTLYYVASDGKRYVYPNANIYHSWFTSFDGVVTITAEEMAAIPLGGSIHYRPGVVLIKIQTDPKVYAVSDNGKLRWVKTESLARKFYGENWANLVDDLQASFFANYHIGEDIDEDDDYDADEEVNDNGSFEHSRGLALGHLIRHANTKRCRVLQRVVDKLKDRNNPGRAAEAISRIIERKCESDDDDDDDDTTKPVISSIVADAATSTAMITWTTNEAARSKVTYADESLATASTTDSVSKGTLVTSHSLQLLGLTPSTTYHYIVESKDASGNTATSTEKVFTTDPLVIPDTTAPIISSIVVTSATTTATITWMTNESATSKITYANESLATASSTSSVSSGVLLTSHSLVLLGLTPSTTYFFMLESKDAANNTATSTQQMFTTSN